MHRIGRGIFAAALVILLGIGVAAVVFLLRAFAEEAGMNPWVFAMVPVALAMLYSLIVYQSAQRKIHKPSWFVSRGILMMLLTWVSFAAVTSWTWCQHRDFGSCLGTMLLASAAVGGGPILWGALTACILAGVLIIAMTKAP
jgi:hypothetical protein